LLSDETTGVQTAHIDWRLALVYVTREPSWKRRIGVGGLLLLIVPPVGWMLALGYRSLVGNRIADARSPILPEWRGNLVLIARRGAASSGVILAYLTPFLLAYWALGLRSARDAFEHWRELAWFVSSVVVFPPLAIPTLPVVYAMRYPWLQFSAGEMCLLAMIFVGPILVLPAAFLQVAQHRRFGAAFKVTAALRLIAAAPCLYVEAWIVSLVVSAASAVAVPLTPWTLFWSYLAISHVFLQVLREAMPAALPHARVIRSDFQAV
jgi:hypothetical protein